MKRHIALLSVLVMGFSVISYAELTPEQTREARTLIEQFSDRAFAVRQQAVDKLVAMGPDVLPLVRKTLAETKDAEVKLRCEMVVKRLTEKPLVPVRVISSGRLVERVVCALGPTGDVREPRVRSPNGETYAYRVKRAGGQLVVRNGVEGPMCDRVQSLRVSRDGKHLAYQAKRGNEYRVVLDGKEGAAHDYVTAPVFSRDGKRMAYGARLGAKAFIVCDGKPWREYGAVRPKWFSDDGRHLLVEASVSTSSARAVGMTLPGAKHFAVVDGAEGTRHDRIKWFYVGTRTYDYDDHRIRYVAIDGDEARLMAIDWPADAGPASGKLVERTIKSLGKTPPEYPKMAYTKISPTGEVLMFQMKRGKQRDLYWNGRWLGPFDNTFLRVVYSPDGRHFAFAARRDGRAFAVHDGKEGPAFDAVSGVWFTPDGKHFIYRGKRDKRWCYVTDGKAGPFHDALASQWFSPDGRRRAWVAKDDDEEVLFLDGTELARGDKVYKLSFSPDGKRLAYVVRHGATRTVICDGIRSRPYAATSSPTFSPDGKHLAYIGVTGGACHMIVDGLRGAGHRKMGPLDHGFKHEGKLRYIVTDGGRQALIEADWPTDREWPEGLKKMKPE